MVVGNSLLVFGGFVGHGPPRRVKITNLGED